MMDYVIMDNYDDDGKQPATIYTMFGSQHFLRFSWQKTGESHSFDACECTYEWHLSVSPIELQLCWWWWLFGILVSCLPCLPWIPWIPFHPWLTDDRHICLFTHNTWLLTLSFMRRWITVSLSLSYSVMITQKKSSTYVNHITLETLLSFFQMLQHNWNNKTIDNHISCTLHQFFFLFSLFDFWRSPMLLFFINHFSLVCLSSLFFPISHNIHIHTTIITTIITGVITYFLPFTNNRISLKMATMRDFYSFILFLCQFLFLSSSSFSDRRSFPVLLNHFQHTSFQWHTQQFKMAHGNNDLCIFTHMTTVNRTRISMKLTSTSRNAGKDWQERKETGRLRLCPTYSGIIGIEDG